MKRPVELYRSLNLYCLKGVSEFSVVYYRNKIRKTQDVICALYGLSLHQALVRCNFRKKR